MSFYLLITSLKHKTYTIIEKDHTRLLINKFNGKTMIEKGSSNILCVFHKKKTFILNKIHDLKVI